MKNEFIQRIVSVINALNNVMVKGEENLANLSGSITVLKETLALLSKIEIVQNEKNEIQEEVK